jgi:guanine deaminase
LLITDNKFKIQDGIGILIDYNKDFLRRAIQLAKIAREQGQEPFGAVLVKNNDIILESTNKIYELSDPTAHAELNLIREFCQKNNLMKLDGFTLYCSTEPCMMCSGAILYSKISKGVFSVSQDMLHKISGGSKKTNCRDILKSQSRLKFIGPELIEEGIKVFEGYTFNASKI